MTCVTMPTYPLIHNGRHACPNVSSSFVHVAGMTAIQSRGSRALWKTQCEALTGATDVTTHQTQSSLIPGPPLFCLGSESVAVSNRSSGRMAGWPRSGHAVSRPSIVGHVEGWAEAALWLAPRLNNMLSATDEVPGRTMSNEACKRLRSDGQACSSKGQPPHQRLLRGRWRSWQHRGMTVTVTIPQL